MKIKTWLAWYLLFSCIFLLAGCDENKNQFERYLASLKSRSAVPIAYSPKFTAISVLPDSPYETKKDPFKQISFKNKQDDNQIDKKESQPLEFYPLNALKFVGTLKGENIVWALIAKPDGKIQSVRIGQTLGQHAGLVIHISEDGLQVEERVKAQGRWKKEIITLKMGTFANTN